MQPWGKMSLRSGCGQIFRFQPLTLHTNMQPTNSFISAKPLHMEAVVSVDQSRTPRSGNMLADHVLSAARRPLLHHPRESSSGSGSRSSWWLEGACLNLVGPRNYDIIEVEENHDCILSKPKAAVLSKCIACQLWKRRGVRPAALDSKSRPGNRLGSKLASELGG
jgi:hypothetical protein